MASSMIDFTKAVSISDTASIDKSLFTQSFALFNSAIGNATADALGAWTHTETLTQTLAVQGVGSSSASESVSQANPVNFSFVV
jgi:Na+-driven multidrug efflux pump